MTLLQLVPHGGSQDQAFEEFCCQLGWAGVADPSAFRRVGGEGGDGGVECVWTSPAGDVYGWQAKYIPDLGRALAEAAKSFTTARGRYPKLSRFIVCLPFDLQGSRGKGGAGKSQQDKFDAFKADAEAEALADGQVITVEPWTLCILDARLTAADPSGGRRRYWFDPRHLGALWFSAQLDNAVAMAGPRYRPELHHGHVLNETLAALCETDDWTSRCEEWCGRVSVASRSWAESLTKRTEDGWSGPFPEAAREDGERLGAAMHVLALSLNRGALNGAVAEATAASVAAVAACGSLAADIDHRFGRGAAGSPSFRQRRAEISVDFPATYLDDARSITSLLFEVTTWLASAAVASSKERVLVLTGPAGIGKTHGLCDGARRRQACGQKSVLVYGSQFGQERSVWESLATALGLDGTWSRDVLLDALDAAAGAGRLLICVDALDERPARQRWQADLSAMVEAIRRRPNLTLAVSFRDAYQRQLLPSEMTMPTLEHPGFADEIFDACSAFFHHHGLAPPTGPFLDPEFANPLFLRVVCEVLRGQGLRELPTGWAGIRTALSELLRLRDREFQHECGGPGNSVTAAMRALAGVLPVTGPIAWSAAEVAIEAAMTPSQKGRGMLERLIGLSLVLRSPNQGDDWATEDAVDIAFGRLRHHLVSDHLLASVTA